MIISKEVEEFFDAIAPARDKWKKKSGYYYHYVEDILLPFLISPNQSILQIGCGTGDLLAKLKPSRGLGIDISPKMIEVARSKYPSGKLEFSAQSIKQLDEKFEVVVISDALGYISDVQSLFEDLNKLTNDKSRIIITQYNQLWEPILDLASRLKLRMPWPIVQNWLSRDDIENLLSLAGFEVVHRGRKMLLPKKIPVISSLANCFLANIPILSKFCLINYVVARKIPNSVHESASVSVIVPARNEAGTIESIAKNIPDMGSGTEIIFVEGHSGDDTLAKIIKTVDQLKFRKIKYCVQDGKGKGDAVRKGFEMASGDILMIYDADMTVSVNDLVKFYNSLIKRRGEFINGSRLVYPLERQSMRFLNYLGNKFFSVAFSWLLGQKVKDTLCGTKVLWKNDYDKIKDNRNFFGDFDPFGDFDLLFGAAKLNLKIVDLPIRYRERKYGQTNISRFKHGWLLLRMVFFAMRKIKFI